jgi:hypothetical protein
VGVPVPNVLRGDRRASDKHQVLGIPLLRRSGEIEATGYHGLVVDDYDATVSYRVLRVDQNDYARAFQEGVTSSSPGALVEDNSDIRDAPLGLNQSLCDGCGDQTPGLNEDLLSR